MPSCSFRVPSDALQDLRLDRHVERRWSGSSAMSRLRLARERHRDHHALAHPAGELVRVRVDVGLGRRDADEAQHLDARAPHLAALLLMEANGLDDLPAHRVDGVEARHRLLEDHRDLVAANFAHLLFGELQAGLFPANSIATRVDARGWHVGRRRRIESAVTLLPQPLSPTTPTDSPSPSFERDVVDRATATRHPMLKARRERDDGEQRDDTSHGGRTSYVAMPKEDSRPRV